jgi:hypothetical protein
MADSKIQIIISAVNMANGAVESARQAIKGYRETLHRLNGTASETAANIRNMVAAAAGSGLFAAAVKSGYAFNSTMEDTRVGLASLMYAMNEFGMPREMPRPVRRDSGRP